MTAGAAAAEGTEQPAAWRGRAVLNAAYSAVAQAASKIATFAWTAVAAHQLSHASFGEFNFAMSLGLLLVTVAEWGLDTALMQRASGDPSQASRLFTEAAAVQAALAFVLFVVAAAVSWPSMHGSREVTLALILAALFLDTFSDTLRTAAAALQQQGGVSLALTAGRIAMAVIAIPVLVTGGGVVALAAAFLVSCALGLGGHLLAAGRVGIRPRLRYLQPRRLLEFTRGTAAFGLSALVLAGLFRFDTILLEWLKGARAVADYAAAYRLFETALFLAFAISGSMFAVMSAAARDPERTVPPLRGGITAVVTLYVPFALVCLTDGRFVLDLVFGHPYDHTSRAALQWLAVAPVAFAVSYLMAAAVTSVGQRRMLLQAAVAATVVNIAGNLLAIPRWAGAGAAAMTTVSYVVHAMLLYVLYRRVVVSPLRLLPPLRPALGGGLLMAAALLVLPVPAPVQIVVGLACYAAAWTLLTRFLEPAQLTSALDFVRSRGARRSSTTEVTR